MRPKLAFLGVGWIGRHRMAALRRSGLAEICAVADADPEVAAAAAAEVGSTAVTPDVLLSDGIDLDGVVIATPSALHAEQAITALRAGRAVFCQKPLGRTTAECAAVVEAARRAGRLLDVDLSYRYLKAVARMKETISEGGIGTVYSTDLVFHNAYGPDKPWFLDPVLSGGGCVIDLGIHLVDLALWMLDGPKVDAVTARLFARGAPASATSVEDHAVARVDLVDGGAITLACSWFLHAGCDAVIAATFYGTHGAVTLRNVGGSFYDFTSDLHRGTLRESLASPPDDWGGRAALRWVRRLADGAQFDPEIADSIEVARVLDRVYGR